MGIGGVGGVILSMKKFRAHCSKVMKAQRAKLHKYFQAIGKRLDKKPPENVKPGHWSRLCEWWLSLDGVTNIVRMKKMRSELKNPSRIERGGYRGKEAEYVSHAFCSLCIGWMWSRY